MNKKEKQVLQDKSFTGSKWSEETDSKLI